MGAAGAPLLEQPVFYVNGQAHTAAGKQNLSLNDYLRNHTPFKGTKLACGEGGCGACAVQVARYDAATDTVQTSSLNSCLCPLGSLDGAAVTTVEGLGSSRAGFSAVQERFAQHHASQCGYCTPGFVVACHATLARCAEQQRQPSAADMLQGLDGNLCRCTGYHSILAACQGLVADMEDLCSRPPEQPPLQQQQAQQPAFPEELKAYARAQQAGAAGGRQQQAQQAGGGEPVWHRVDSLAEAFAALSNPQLKGAAVLAGNTASGVYHRWPAAPVIVSIRHLPELTTVSCSQAGLQCGAAVPFAQLIAELRRPAGGAQPSEAWRAMAAHVERIAGSHVRWAATPGGNLALLRDPAHRLESDFATVLMGAGGRVQVSSAGDSRWLSVADFLSSTDLDLGRSQLITAVSLPAYGPGERFWSHKVAQRHWNAHAMVNLAVGTRQDADGQLQAVRLAIGCPTLVRDSGGCEARVAWQLRRGSRAEAALLAGGLTPEGLADALEALQQDICPGTTMDAPAGFYRAVAEGLALQGLAPLVPASEQPQPLARLLTGLGLPPLDVPAASQAYPQPPSEQAPVGLPIEKDRVRLQASGEAVYSSDVGLGSAALLHAAVVCSTQALAAIEAIDASAALKVPGVVAFVGAADVPGENAVFLGGADAEIFPAKTASHVGQPLGLVVAESPRAAAAGAALVAVSYSHPQELGLPILSIADAIAAGSYHPVPDGAGGRVRRGDPPAALAAAKHVIRDAKYTIPSQQHFYMETQAAVAQLSPDGGCLVHSSTQSIDAVQSAVARALGLPGHAVVAVCRRVGGGFGGKVSRALPVAAAAAVAAAKTGRPVRLQLSRNEDMRINGGRSEAELEYTVGFDDSGKISALSVRGWWLAGSDLDLAWNDMMIIQTGADQVYNIPNIALDLKVVRTNLPPRTIVRGPGFVTAALLIEQVLSHVAAFVGADPRAARALNFLQAPEQEGAAAAGAAPAQQQPGGAAGKLLARVRGVCARALPHGGRPAAGAGGPLMQTTLSRPFSVSCWTLPRIWEGLLRTADYGARAAAVAAFNARHAWRKRGISINPCRFDSAPQPMSAQVSVYWDGSVLVTHGGLEVGQGLSTKVKQMVCLELSRLLPERLRPLPLELLRVNDTRSDAVPNSGPTWSSTGSESACAAAAAACAQIVASLAPAAAEVAKEGSALGSAAAFWAAAVAKVHPQVGYSPASALLTAVGFFDGSAQGGPAAGKEPMAYTSFGAAVSEVELCVLSGEQRVLRCDIHFDCGRSLNPAVDMGQVEGAFVQGLGYVTSERVAFDPRTGALLTDGTWTYKLPTAACVPQQLRVDFLKDSPNPRGVLSSKASGEPSLLLSTSVLHALGQAVAAARAELGTAAPGERFFSLPAPATTTSLKQACGEFSVAGLLRAAAGAGRDSASDSSWVEVPAGQEGSP